MRLVADDDRVGVGDVAGVADEPLVGLHRHGAVGSVLAAQQRGRDAVAIAAVAQLAVELVDQVAAVREDQDRAGPRGLDEAERGDGLAGPGRVLEPEAAGGVGILGLLLDRQGVRVDLAALVPVLRLLGLVLVEILLAGDARRGQRAVQRGQRAVGDRVAVLLSLGQQLGQRARQGVDLMRGEHRAVGEHRLVQREQPVEPQQQRPALAPRDRRHLGTRVQFGERGVQRPAACRTGGEDDGGILPLGDERLAREARGALDVIECWNGRDRVGHWRDFGHERLRSWKCGSREPSAATPRARGPIRGPLDVAYGDRSDRASRECTQFKQTRAEERRIWHSWALLMRAF